jgi:diguanylate cyclase (GGDEF)-like protein/PAS domain S-box-containing protein
MRRLLRRLPLRLPSLRSLKTRIVAVVGLLSLGGMAVLAFEFDRTQQRELEQMLTAQQFSIASYVAHDIDGKLQTRMHALESVAHNLPAHLLRDAGALESWLADRRAIYTLFPAGLMLVRPDGSGAIADYPPLPGRRSNTYLDRDWFIAARDGDRTVISKPLLGRAAAEPVIVVATPVRDGEGRLRAIIAGVTPLAAPDFLDQLQRVKLGSNGDFLLIDPRHGLHVAGTDRRLHLMPLPPPGSNRMLDRYIGGYQGSGVAANAHGVLELSSAVQVPSAGWFLIARLPISEAFAPIANTRRHILSTVLLAGLPLALLLWLSLRHLLQPLSEAARALRRMARGTLPFRQLPMRRNDEIGDLVHSFNLLQQHLQDKENALALSNHELASSQSILAEAQRIAEMGNWQYLPQDDRLTFSAGMYRLFGLDQQADAPTPATLRAACHPDDLPLLTPLLAADAAAGPSGRREANIRLCQRDGAWRNFRVLAEIADGPDGERIVNAIAQDTTERRREEQSLRLAMLAIENTSDSVFWIDHEGCIIYANAAASQALGYSAAQLHGMPFEEIDERYPQAAWQTTPPLWQHLHSGQTELVESLQRNRAGQPIPVEMSLTVVEVNHQTFVSAVCRDIAERKVHEEGMRHAAYHDPLTDLPNRALFQDLLEQAISHADHKTGRLAVMFIDLDRFKPVNDQHGHEVGDLLLRQVADRLRQAVRRADTVARLGGDEFVILLADIGSRDTVARIAEQCIQRLSQPFLAHDLSLSIGASIGIALYPEHAASADLLIAHADAAMYQAKRNGRNRHDFFSQTSPKVDSRLIEDQ